MEILAPAGSIEKFKYAICYGADAVYVGGKAFSLRAQATNLNNAELKEAVKFAHSHQKKIYVTLNVYAHNADYVALTDFIDFLASISIDAVIVSDPGVFQLVKKQAPSLDIHISTQANVVSSQSAKFWYSLGAKRIILARELSLEEIAEIKYQNPGLELEMFVHGAMCMAYSGRCLLSSFLNDRDANAGLCSQPCRWKYHLFEETRPGNYFPITEDENGTYILNSKDLCLINRLHDLEKIGIDSIKIEGRMKSVYYVANVTRAYNYVSKDPNNKELVDYFRKELDKISHRVYTEGFVDKFDSVDTQYHTSSAYLREYQYLGNIISKRDNSVEIAVKSKFELGDLIDFIFPDYRKDFQMKIDKIINEQGQEILFSKPNTSVFLEVSKTISEYGIIRKKINND